MIQIVPLDGTPIQHFESFDELFEDIITTENSKLGFFIFLKLLLCLAPRDGLEPPTQWLTATCSTN